MPPDLRFDKIEGECSFLPPIKVLIFGSLVEAFLIAYVGPGLLKIRVNTRQLIIISLLYTLSLYIVRSKYVMPYLGVGMHSILLVLMLAFIMKTVLKIKFRTSIAAALFPFILIFAGDAALLSPLLKFTGINVAQITQNTWRWIFLGWISDAFLLLMAFLIVKKGFYILPAPDAAMEIKSVEGKQ